MRKLLFATLVFANCFAAMAQSDPEIPLMRRLLHENIDKAQKEICLLDGTDDGAFKPSANDDLNPQINRSATTIVDKLQKDIERDSTFDTNNKIKYLRSLNEILTQYAADFRAKRIKGAQLPELIDGFTTGMALEEKNKACCPLLKKARWKRAIY